MKSTAVSKGEGQGMLNGLEESCVSARSLLKAGIEGASAGFRMDLGIIDHKRVFPSFRQEVS